nr:uncharacterized protein LOC107976709 isoform X3 [Pan troglodytes]
MRIKTPGSFLPLRLPAKQLHESKGSSRAGHGSHRSWPYSKNMEARAVQTQQQDRGAWLERQCQGSLKARNTVSFLDWSLRIFMCMVISSEFCIQSKAITLKYERNCTFSLRARWCCGLSSLLMR